MLFPLGETHATPGALAALLEARGLPMKQAVDVVAVYFDARGWKIPDSFRRMITNRRTESQ
jgi:hypothetical protein